MLRNSKHVRHVWLSSTSRFFTMGVLASLGLLIVGFRGPLATPAVTAQTALLIRLLGAPCCPEQAQPVDHHKLSLKILRRCARPRS